MIHQPRDYQLDLEQRVYAAWNGGARNVLAVMPTGAGKTFTFARIAAAASTSVAAIAHRAELVSQMSLAFAREGVRHRVIGPATLARRCSALHIEMLGNDYIQPGARVAVAGVDTMLRMPASDPFFAQVRLWIQDEAHHVLKDNKWGKVAAMMPTAIGLGVTATPTRADGKGLGMHADGLFEAMVVGPSMRELIDRGFLCDYRIFAPPSDIDLSDVTTSANGDYSPPKLAVARKRSHITGDIVQHYCRIARGKLGVTFDVDIESATATAAAFNAEGIPAAVISGESTDEYRALMMRKFRNRELLQLVSVDIMGEGVDVPGIEVASFGRPTQSYGLFVQQFGRTLRILDGKTHGIIIDHVGNTIRHGLPDARREWTLDRRERRSRSAPSDVVPVRACLQCQGVYERVYSACPYCGHAPVPAGRSAPEQVDGDLFELDPAVLARLRGDILKTSDAPLLPTGVSSETVGAIRRRHWERQQAQAALRNTLAVWGGWQESLARPMSESWRRFFFKFGIDVGTAQALGAREAEELNARVAADLEANNIKGTT